jgi:dipeptidase D
MVLENLNPKIVWDIFENLITKTPRPSKHEEKIRNRIKQWITEQGKIRSLDLKLFEDDVGNILINRTPSKGMESYPSLLLQGHLDMICESDRPEGYDFFNKGIPIRIQDNNEWIDAEGTTLGADNGIGISLALAILIEKDIEDNHGPIEVLLTVNEEDGFTGATGLNVEKLNIKSKYMINLDSGPIGEITIGSVCGRRTYFRRTFEWINNNSRNDLQFIELKVMGLLSGHSGGDIHLPRANAIKLIARILSLINEQMEIYICFWNGGSKGNVIPSESHVKFAINSNNLNLFENVISKEIAVLNEYYNSDNVKLPKLEPKLKIEWKYTDPADFLSYQDSKNIISTSNVIPNGVIRKSPFYEDFVETSINFGTVKTENKEIEFQLYPRSIIREELNNFCRSMVQLGELANWQITLRPVLPEWVPKPESEFLRYVKEQYEKILRNPVKTSVIHGGLETGEISKKLHGVEMVSIGPTIIGEHTPNEKLKIADVQVIYELLLHVIKNISEL